MAGQARRLLEELGYRGFPKTSGNRGVHIYLRVVPRWTFTDVRHGAIALARELERRLPTEVTTKWWKEERGARIFIDYNQNARDRTIASAYSLRPRPGAPVSTPLTWEELDEPVDPRAFHLRTVPQRVAELGDLHAPINDRSRSRCSRCSTCTTPTIAAGQGEMPYPPEYPKMPGEPLRVQPSRKRVVTSEDTD